ncbi:DUF11 domain-containing protein [Methanolobus bombayensis]|uniref:DUF11 domain-containing protein n=1 Tax=Methanolobus bombayensis TaxID=38023 RepID=UPI001AE9EE2D|nr:DUF11 domain-containing protein [Methanolobus bombayensis]MBP1909050.1 putative repeat protein (TIGR01451 family) [Methanolobus bombayensis]
MTKYNILFVIALIIISLSGTVAAIEVDGVRSTGEWDENWNFGQVNASDYDSSGPFGNKMVVFQNGSWYDEDLPADAGSNFNENLSTEGPYPSGYDIKGIYADYDILNDTLYGMSTVYGLPGDLDGDGNIVGLTANGDVLGNVSGRPITGIGPGEQWSIILIQEERMIMVVITDNDFEISTSGITGFNEDDIFAANSNAGGPENCSDCVYEISINNLSSYFDMTPGKNFSVAASAGGNLDIVGEDIAAVFFEIPEPSIDIEKSTNGEDADTAPGPGIPENNSLIWTYVVTNNGNVPLQDISVTDDKLGAVTNLISNGDGDDILAVEETWIYAVEGIAECGQYENNATVVGFFDIIPVFDTDPSHYFGECPDIDIEKATNGEDADTAPGPGVAEGDLVTWTYVVTNTGNVNLTNIQVTDDMLGSISNIVDQGDGDAVLSIGEIWTYEATGDAECGQYENEGNVTGDYNEVTVSDIDPSHYFGECPDIDIEKATNGEDADTAPGPGVAEGDTVTWTYVVTNTGNVNLTNIQVTDDMLGSISNIVDQGDGDAVLSIGEIWTYEATGEAECGQYENEGNVTGDYDDVTVTDEDPSHYFGECPDIDIEKATNGEDADTAPGPGVAEGDTVTWTYVVTNTGNVPLSNVVVSDDQGVVPVYQNGDTNVDGILDLTEIWTYEVEGTASCGQYANIGNVTGDYDDVTVTDEDPSHYFGECPDIDIEKATNGEDADTAPGPGVAEGDTVTWTYVVTNTGNVNLTNIQVSDDMLGSISNIVDQGDGDDTLAVGEVWTYEATGDAECGQYANEGNVTGDYNEVTVTDEDPSHYFGECPDIDIEKATNGEDADTAPGPGVAEGDTVTWTYVVTNTGNVNLTNIQVSDDMLGSISNIVDQGDGDAVLSIGEIWTYEATGDAECGQYENEGNVTGDYNEVTVSDIDPSHYFGECPDIDIEKATNGEDADTAPGPGVAEGDTVTWTYVVTNTGNVNLTNIQVTDDMLGSISNIVDQGDGDAVLSIGEIWTYEATGDAECGQYANIGNVTGDYDDVTVTDEDPSHYFGECADIDIEKATNGEDADTAPGPGVAEGDTVTWTYVVTNTGNVPLSNVVVTDDQDAVPVYQSGDTNVDGILDLTETWTYEATGDAECGQYANIGNVTGDYDDVTVTDEDPSHYFGECPDIDIEKATNGEDADTAPGPGVAEGDLVTWTYVVTNTGNVPLSNVVVTDDQDAVPVYQSGDTNVDGILDLTETWTYEATGDAECGQYANIGNVTGDYDDVTVTDEDPSHYFGECPDIDIEKATNGEDADTAPGPGVAEGDLVTWTYVVTNTGNVPLSNVVVSDDQGVVPVYQSGDTNVDGILDLTEIWTYEATGDAECGQYENEGNVTGDYDDVTVTDEDPSHYFGECPDIDIEKATNGEDADTAPGPGVAEGDTVTWTYVVTNTGNVNLTNIQVTDDMLGSISNIVDQGDGDAVLSIGEIWTYEATGDAECGQYENEGNVTGDYNEVTVSDIDPSHYFGECPDIDIEKATNGEDADTAPGPGVAEGDLVTWTYVVTNTGNVNLTNIQVTDDMLGSISNIVDQGDGDAVLSIGEIWTYEATGDAECGQYTNEGNVTGDYNEVTVTDEDPSHYFGECPDIDIEKATNGEDADTAPGPGVAEGDLVTWTYVVTNTGNVPLSNVVVTDDQDAVPVYQSGDTNVDGILDLTETWTYEATGDAECGQYANIGNVTGDYDDVTVTDEDPSHYFGECPDIDIEKATNGEDADTAPGPGVAEGDLVTWTYVVTNTGNVNLTNIQVSDDMLGSISNIVDQGDGDDTLAIGEVWTYEATGDAECGQYANEGNVTGDYDGGTVNDSDLSHYFGECPDIDIEKATNGEDADTAPGPELDAGDVVTWTYVVANTGNVNLTNVSVTDNQLGVITNIVDQGDGDNILAVGEIWTYEATGSASCGDYGNIGTVTGDYNDVTVSDEDPSHYNVVCIPRIDIEKSTNGVDADVAPGPTLGFEDNVTWVYVVRNTGNVQLTNVTVNDDQLGAITNIVDKGNGDDMLLPGEEWTYDATGTAECGQYANIGDVVGYYGAIPVTDSDPSHYNVDCGPDIDIEKYINGNDADQAPGVLLAVGDGITWTFVVENTGNVPLENIVVDDDKLGVIPASSIISKSINNDDILDPGEVWTYELENTVTECLPQHKNTAIVTGEFEGSEVTDEDVAHYYCQPVVPLLSPVGMIIFVAALGLIGTIYLRRRE